ncbi:Phosphatidylinositol (PI) 3-kinase [Ascosphaera pollenicola]|nr:Phosphatidylinositol (PI) 3-kinase [Ascosphaera pollenicola]
MAIAKPLWQGPPLGPQTLKTEPPYAAIEYDSRSADPANTARTTAHLSKEIQEREPSRIPQPTRHWFLSPTGSLTDLLGGKISATPPGPSPKTIPPVAEQRPSTNTEAASAIGEVDAGLAPPWSPEGETSQEEITAAAEQIAPPTAKYHDQWEPRTAPNNVHSPMDTTLQDASSVTNSVSLMGLSEKSNRMELNDGNENTQPLASAIDNLYSLSLAECTEPLEDPLPASRPMAPKQGITPPAIHQGPAERLQSPEDSQDI